MKHSKHSTCVLVVVSLLLVQVGASEAPDASVSQSMEAAGVTNNSPLGIPDALDSYLGAPGASAAAASTPSFLDLAKYAWSGHAPAGANIMLPPAAASKSAASAGNSYEASVHRALDVLVTLFPHEAGNINTHREQLVAAIVSGNETAPASLLEVQHATTASTDITSAASSASLLSPCLEAVISVIVDFVGVVLSTVSFVGGSPPAWGKVSSSMVGQLRGAGSWLSGFHVLIANMHSAGSVTARLAAVGKLVSEIFSQGGRIVLQAFKDSLRWWDWVRFGVNIVLSIGAFSLSGGAWLTVKLVSVVWSDIQLVGSIAAAVTACV